MNRHTQPQHPNFSRASHRILWRILASFRMSGKGKKMSGKGGRYLDTVKTLSRSIPYPLLYGLHEVSRIRTNGSQNTVSSSITYTLSWG